MVNESPKSARKGQRIAHTILGGRVVVGFGIGQVIPAGYGFFDLSIDLCMMGTVETRQHNINQKAQAVMKGITMTRDDAHEYNLDAAYQEIERREAQGEDMSRAYVDNSTYAIVFAETPMDALAMRWEALPEDEYQWQAGF